MRERRIRVLEALTRRGDAPRSVVPRVRALGASLLPSGAATSSYVETTTSPFAVYVTAPERPAVYVTAPGTTAPAIPGVEQSVTPTTKTATVTAPSSTAQDYRAPASAVALMSPPLPYPSRLEPFPLGTADLVCSEHNGSCTPESVASVLFRVGDYAYAQATLRYLLGRKPAATDLVNVIGWSRAVCDAVSVAMSALNLWHVPTGSGRYEVIARYYSMNPSLALGFNPDLYRGYVEVPELAAFWQRHFRGTAFLSAGSEYGVLYAPSERWSPYGSAPRVSEEMTLRISDPRRPVTPQMLAMQPATVWDAMAYDSYVRALWLHQGGIADSSPGWFAIVGIPKRSDSDAHFSRSTFWIAQPSAQLEFCSIWANFIAGKSFQEMFELCFTNGWRRRYVAADVISLSDANAVSRGIKDLRSMGNVTGAWAAGAASAGAAFVASGPAGAVAAWAVAVLLSGINYARSVSAAQALGIELARHPIIQPMFRRWLTAPECNASGASSLATAPLMEKYGAAFAKSLEALTAASAAPAPTATSPALRDLMTQKKRNWVPWAVGAGVALVGALALRKRKR